MIIVDIIEKKREQKREVEGILYTDELVSSTLRQYFLPVIAKPSETASCMGSDTRYVNYKYSEVYIRWV